ncbi:MAG TPA: vWA domain-containing protein [Myxococcota bacterium]|nr:vWA domain-containing protein [Myxococcota bacterium]
MRSPRAALALALALLALRARAGELPEITLTLDTVDVVRPPASDPGLGFLSGKAFAHEGPIELFDVVFVIDTSGSTAISSGLGKNAGWLSRLPGVKVARADSVLGAEVSAIESLLDGFDARVTRVGLVSFAGDLNPYSSHAWVDAPLTSDFQAIRNALADRLLVDPEGGTDLAAGLLRGAIELLGTRSAESSPRAHATKNLVVLTDGMPTLPERDPVDAAIRAARSLEKRDIRVHVFAIGREADGAGREIEPVAETTHGEYHAVRDLSKLAPLLAKIQFRSLRELRVTNKSTGAQALQLDRDDTGAWSALVPFKPGVNQIEVVAIASDGRERSVERDVTFGSITLDVEQQARRDRLVQMQAEAKAKAAREKKLAIEPEQQKNSN